MGRGDWDWAGLRWNRDQNGGFVVRDLRFWRCEFEISDLRCLSLLG